MRKIIIFLMIIAAATVSVAQNPLSFYAKAGIGTSRFYGKHSSSETKIAYKAGVGAKYSLNRTWALQSGLEFVSIGGKDEISYVGKATLNELYLQLPVMIAAKLQLGEDYRAAFSFGPYIACGVGGKTSGQIYEDYSSSRPSGGYRFKIDTFGNMADNNMGNKRLDAGILMGITLTYRRMVFGVEAQVGLMKVNEQLNQVMNQDGYGRFLPKNFSSFFTLGYRF